jgi:hypothetical protein
MSRNLYIRLFVALATAFVPVVFFFGFVVFTIPNGWGYASIIRHLFKGDWRLVLGLAFYTSIYTGIFYLAAILSHAALCKISLHSVRLTLQMAILGGVFSCSFLRQLTYQSLQGQGGTYTFWSAIERVLEKRK